MEGVLGIGGDDKIEYPHQGEDGCEDCKLKRDSETCNELYEEWLEEQIVKH